MAVDLALLESGEGLVLRLYAWDPPGLSIGWFQDPPADVPPGCQVVRRPTGGGAILHADELTFALAGPAGEDPFAGGIRSTYEAVNRIAGAALRAAGIEAAPRGPTRRERRRGEPFLCFERSSPFDLVHEGRKVCGTSQRRTRERCLVHGSIPGRTDLGPFLVDSLARATGRRLEPSALTEAEREAARRFEPRFALVAQRA